MLPSLDITSDPLEPSEEANRGRGMTQVEETLSPEYVAAHADMPATLPSGGDFHTAFPLDADSGNIAVVLGDVAGHGPEQTGQAAQMRELLSDCLAAGLTPADTLAAVNALLEPDPNFQGFGTVFVGTLEAGTGKLTYASGGHEPALISPEPQSDSESVLELAETGPLVGALPPDMAPFDQHEVVLPPGGTLLLYTDGIPEVRPPHSRRDWLGLTRLKSFFVRLTLLPPGRLVAGLLRRITDFCRGRFDDDISVLVIRRLASKK